jgi:hypothetical protein
MTHLPEAVKIFFHFTNRNKVRVEGTSMWPSIRNNQLVDISYAPTTLQPGTCYAFLYKGRLIAHRFVTYYNGKAIFMGDRSLSIEAIAVNCVIGKIHMPQYFFIAWMITTLNLFFFHLYLSLHKGKSLRVACILFLTIGAHYARKV